MISDRALQELFTRKATEMEIDRSMPRALTRRVRRRRGLIVLTGAAAVIGIAVFAWMGDGSPSLSEAIPPARHKGNEVDTPVIGRAPTPARLAGIWIWDDGGTLEPGQVMFRFSPDGTFAADDFGQIDTNAAIFGTYEISGNAVTFRPGPDGQACVTGNNWTWRMGIEPDGRMHTVMLEDGESNCSIGLGTEWSFTRVSPSSPAGAGIADEASDLDGAPPNVPMLPGIWLEPASGRLHRFAWDMTYAVDDSGLLGVNPDDAGTFEVDDEGNITFTSGAESRICPEGAVTVWKAVRVSNRTMRGVVKEGQCTEDVGAEGTWILIGSP